MPDRALATTAAFADRRHAGQVLAGRLHSSAGGPGITVLGLPRGGVPVAAEVAAAVGGSLDVFVVRKLGVPGHEELAMGAVASGDVRVLHHEVIDALGIPPETIEAVTARARAQLARQELAYRGGRPPLAVGGRSVIVVDDGLATGSTMRAAVAALRLQGPASITVAVPVAPAAVVRAIAEDVDAVVCASTPDPFIAVGWSYRDFSATTDDEVRALLEATVPPRGPA